jgi:hypothetical protein
MTIEFCASAARVMRVTTIYQVHKRGSQFEHLGAGHFDWPPEEGQGKTPAQPRRKTWVSVPNSRPLPKLLKVDAMRRQKRPRRPPCAARACAMAGKVWASLFPAQGAFATCQIIAFDSGKTAGIRARLPPESIVRLIKVSVSHRPQACILARSRLL